MPIVHPLEDLRRSRTACLFEGARHGGGVAISMFVTAYRRGQGPDLHTHPYAEVFFVAEGDATFHVAGDEHEVGAGHFVVVPPETVHGFTCSGDGVLRVVSSHPSPEVVQRDLEG